MSVANKISAETLAALLAELSLDLVEVRDLRMRNNRVLRVTISSKTSHIGHSECAAVTKLLRENPLLDEWGLEVCSPGIGRELSSDRDFQIFIGKMVEVFTTDGQRFVGLLAGRDALSVRIKELAAEHTTSFESMTIQKVCLAYDSRRLNESTPPEISIEE